MPEPGAVAMVSMMHRAPRLAYFDGEFWRSCDASGPVRCVPAAVTSARPVVVSESCPTCSWPSRETVGMVCETCGWDYMQGEKP